MATKDILSETLDDFGLEMSDLMLERCIDLCISYNIDPREFVEMYMAFVLNHLNGAEATESTLDDFERKELASNKLKAASNVSKAQISINNYDEIGSDEDDNVMDAYIPNCTTPKAKKPNRSHCISTPVSSLRDRSSIESPISVSLKDVTGKVVYTFGTASLIKSIDWINSAAKQTVTFERVSEYFHPNQNYMYDKLLQKTGIAADRIFDIGEEICNKLIKEHSDIYEKDLHSKAFKFSVSTHEATKCVGRVCSDSDDKLGLHSTLLIGADEMCLRSYRLQFDRMKNFALFPGQTVFVQGVNPRGDPFFVDEIIAERNLTYAAQPQVNENLNIIVACGPFTYTENLNYEPFNELIAYCKKHKPDVLILIGPLLDADHKSVQDGISMKTSVDEYIEKLITDFVINIGPDTEVFVVSSNQDLNSTAVYPTAPYSLNVPNVTFLPDPCIIKLNGVTIGMTATDIYNHITEAEIAVNAGDRVKRVANYLFNQGSFYPLNPASEKISVDSGLLQQFASLPIVPNILILRSDAKCFAREVKDGTNGCLVLNPGQMCENTTNGTFSRLVVTPAADESTSLNKIIACQIVKL